MNPPSALHGAMSRDRKPFTYTPGGLDLSEIKSERMAQRLMRNAMNQGVPERPQNVLSPPTPTTPVAVPNFNCLPVQVFPAFNLPANPKSLLRTRSIPGQPSEPPQPAPPPQLANNAKQFAPAQNDTFNNTPTYPQQTNNNRPASMYEYTPAGSHSIMNYGSDGNTAAFPEMSYNAPYFNAESNTNKKFHSVAPPVMMGGFDNGNNGLPKYDDVFATPTKTISAEIKVPIDISPVTEFTTPEEVITKPVEEDQGSIEQKEVKIVTKQVKTESNVEEHNGKQNGDGDTEAAMTVTLPTKKSAAKTETQVEILKKILPDGSVEEVKKTTTTTTIDGKTETKIKTETRIIPKDDEEEVEEVEEEENEEEEVEESVQPKEQTETVNVILKENGHDNIIKTEEKSETTTTSTKKMVVVQDDEEANEEEEVEEVEEDVDEEVEAEPVTFVIKKPAEKPPTPVSEPEEEVNEEEEVVEEVEVEQTKAEVEKEEIKEEVCQQVEEEKKTQPEEEQCEVEEEEYEEAEVKQEETKVEAVAESVEQAKEEIPKENGEVETKTPVPETPVEEPEVVQEDEKQEVEAPKVDEIKEEVIVEKQELKAENQGVREIIITPTIEQSETPEIKIPLREPSVPLEKVEDVEIKPLSAGDFVTRTRTESTEIITNAADKPAGLLTEYNRTENIVTVNRTFKTLDNSFESITKPISPMPSYFTPHVEKISSPQPSRPYQPVYPPEPATERRHSLLLERLSTERQMPSEIYQYSNQTSEQQRQWSQEPQAEVVTVSNVKPSMITNQQWYQQTKKDESVYEQSAPGWTQPLTQSYSPQPQQFQPQTQPQYLPQAQPQPQPQAQPQYQPQPKPQYQPQQQQQFQPRPQPQYQPTYTENTQQNTANSQQMYSSYTSQPSNWSSSVDTNKQSNQYSFSQNDSTESYQNTQHLSSSYVPPPWEQDSTYVVDTSQNFYQPPPDSNTFTAAPNEGWKPTPPTGKFSKTAPTAYIPPKPNQSFVKPLINVEPPKTPGRKTYYSEYERRYISVPESTYIPAETKYQPQPDPSPQYYYDNNEPTEPVEHEWRKELREFTEKTQTQTQTESSVKPPWEMESKLAKAEAYTPTPTWSQTLRPQTWRERSFESEFVSQTNTLGRGRPLSSYGKEVVQERTRGVSVDRYNPSSYQAPVPAEHPPVQTFTHNPPAQQATGYHNPNVPAYHSRASAEPREQVNYQQPRPYRELRASPFQSRSFKYLQWITGTDD